MKKSEIIEIQAEQIKELEEELSECNAYVDVLEKSIKKMSVEKDILASLNLRQLFIIEKYTNLMREIGELADEYK